MRQATLGFLAGMVVMAALIMVELWGLTPRQPDGGDRGSGFTIDLRDC